MINLQRVEKGTHSSPPLVMVTLLMAQRNAY